MSKRRDNRRKRSQAVSGWVSGRGVPPPSLSLPARRFPTALPAVPSYYRLTRPPARPSVSRLPTVRPLLMRTVFTDTTFSRRRTPARGVPTLNRRPSPDLPNRSIDRSLSLNAYLDRAWPVLSDKIPLQRATHCARRQIRREVLFALHRTNGAGSRGVPKSPVRCAR